MGVLLSDPPWLLTYFTETTPSWEHGHVVLGSKPAKVGLIGSKQLRDQRMTCRFSGDIIWFLALLYRSFFSNRFMVTRIKVRLVRGCLLGRFLLPRELNEWGVIFRIIWVDGCLLCCVRRRRLLGRFVAGLCGRDRVFDWVGGILGFLMSWFWNWRRLFDGRKITFTYIQKGKTS